jgi:hypothetical protein
MTRLALSATLVRLSALLVADLPVQNREADGPRDRNERVQPRGRREKQQHRETKDDGDQIAKVVAAEPAEAVQLGHVASRFDAEGAVERQLRAGK